jgi:hypothetical protein
LQFLFATAFATLKILGASESNSRHVLLLRLFFGISHAFILFCFLKAKGSLVSMMASQDAKLKLGDELKSLARSVLARCAVIIAVHAKTGMIQPLVISSVLGYISLFENRTVYNELTHIFPFLKTDVV